MGTAIDGNGNGSISLDNNFATQANLADLPLQITFRIMEVSGYTDTSRWIQFNVGGTQHLAVNDDAVALGTLFRVEGGANALSAGGDIGSPATWTPGDLVTITLADTAGTGSAFDGGGSKASVRIGANDLGTFPLPQQTNAFLNFSGFNFGPAQIGAGTIDDLSVALVPEPSAALLGGLGLIALLRRRR